MFDRHLEAMGSPEPEPECSDGMVSIASGDLEEYLYYFCSD